MEVTVCCYGGDRASGGDEYFTVEVRIGGHNFVYDLRGRDGYPTDHYPTKEEAETIAQDVRTALHI